MALVHMCGADACDCFAMLAVGYTLELLSPHVQWPEDDVLFFNACVWQSPGIGFTHADGRDLFSERFHLRVLVLQTKECKASLSMA